MLAQSGLNQFNFKPLYTTIVLMHHLEVFNLGTLISSPPESKSTVVQITRLDYRIVKAENIG